MWRKSSNGQRILFPVPVSVPTVLSFPVSLPPPPTATRSSGVEERLPRQKPTRRTLRPTYSRVFVKSAQSKVDFNNFIWTVTFSPLDAVEWARNNVLIIFFILGALEKCYFESYVVFDYKFYFRNYSQYFLFRLKMYECLFSTKVLLSKYIICI